MRVTKIQKFSLAIFGISFAFVISELILWLTYETFVFQKQLQRLPGHTNDAREIRILALGESTTAFGYSEDVAKLLNQAHLGCNFTAYNRGVPGTTTTLILKNLEKNIKETNPHIIISMMGINDGLTSLGAGNESALKKFISNFRTYKLICAAVRSLGESNIKRSREIFQEAEQLRRKRPTLESQALYEKAIELNPIFVEAYVKLIALLRFHDRIERAEYWYNIAKSKLDFSSYDVHETLVVDAYTADCCFSDEEQESKLLKSISINPTNDVAWSALGSLYNRQKKTGDATRAFLMALTYNPRNDRAHGLLASMYMSKNLFVEAERLYKKFISNYPDDFRGYAGLKNVYQRSGQFEKANQLQKKLDTLKIDDYSAITKKNYLELIHIAKAKGIKVVAVQYPLRDVSKLKKMLDEDQDILFVDNSQNFIKMVAEHGYDKIFTDYFAGDFGHMSTLGKKTLAFNVARVIASSLMSREQSICEVTRNDFALRDER